MTENRSLNDFTRHVRTCQQCQHRLTGVTSALKICEIAEMHGFIVDSIDLKNMLDVESKKPTISNSEKGEAAGSAPLHCYICSGYKLWSCDFACGGGIVALDS